MRPGVRTFHHGDFDTEELVRAKAGRLVSVCLPARNEEATVGAIVAMVLDRLGGRSGLVDEVLVLDDHSDDATGVVAAAAGARVMRAADVLADHGTGPGKGEALWKSLYGSQGDLVVWCDADIVDFDPQFVVGLLGPLLSDRGVEFVKGFYDRPVQYGKGGRVTELVARPLLSVLFPHLTSVVQPLAGEFGGTRRLLEQLPFVRGYGVDLGLLLDVADRFGINVMGQVDLGCRVHRNRTLDELAPQATAVIQTALRRTGTGLAAAPSILVRPGSDSVTIAFGEQPPLVSVPSYRACSA